MKRALTVSTAIAVLVTVGCSSDGPDQTTRSTDSRPTPSTLATATDPTDHDRSDRTPPIRPIRPIRSSPIPAARVRSASPGSRSSATARRCSPTCRSRPASGSPHGASTAAYYYGPGMPVDMAAAEDSAGGDASRVEAPAATSRRARTSTTPAPTPRRSASTRVTSSRPTATTCTWPARTVCASSRSPTPTVVASPELPAGAHQMILDGNRLLVATQGYTTAEDTVVSLFDVSDPTNPTLLRRSHLEGRLVASRASRRHGPPGAVELARRPAAVRPPRPVRARRGSLARAQPGRSSTSRRCRIGCRVGSTRPATGRSARWRSRSTAPTSPPPVTSRVSASRGSPRSTSTARRRRTVRPASCRPARRCTPRRPASTSPPSRGTGTGRSSRAARPPTRTRRHPP